MKAKIFKIFLAVSFLLIILFIIWSFYVEPRQLLVNNYNLKLQKWSAKQNGFRIVAISDIHGGSNAVDEARIRELVEKANAQNPDIIVLLGDYVARTLFDRTKLKMPLETVMENLRGFKAKYGVYAVIGNHDNSFKDLKVRESLERDGYKVLENEEVVFQHNGEWIRLLGTDDVLKAGNSWSKISQDLKTKLATSEVKVGKLIVLTHNPDAIVYLTEELSISDDFTLLLAGHTHGGQCRFPIIGAPMIPSEFGQKYAAGHVRDKGIDMFVTTGVGTSVFPLRFGVPPEIAVLELYAE